MTMYILNAWVVRKPHINQLKWNFPKNDTTKSLILLLLPKRKIQRGINHHKYNVVMIFYQNDISKNRTKWALSTQTSHIHRRLKHQKSVTLFTNLTFTFLFHVHKIWHDIKLLKWFNCVVENVIRFISANRYFFGSFTLANS